MIALVGFWGCNWFSPKSPKSEEQPLARVYDQFLYPSDPAIAAGGRMVAGDSTERIRQQVNSWVRKRLVYETAKNNLPSNLEDIERKVQDYRESLIIYRYENELLNQKMDTTVSPQELSRYYEDYKQNFELRRDIVRFRFVKLSKGTPKMDSVQVWMDLNQEESLARLREFCKGYALEFHLNDTLWMETPELFSQLPFEPARMEVLTKFKRYGQAEDSCCVYHLKVLDYLPAKAIAPLSYVHESIARIILNKRKTQLLNDSYEAMYRDALSKGRIEFFEP